jgi:hypothetical protein
MRDPVRKASGIESSVIGRIDAFRRRTGLVSDSPPGTPDGQVEPKTVRAIRRNNTAVVMPGSQSDTVVTIRRRRTVEITTTPVQASPPPAPVREVEPKVVVAQPTPIPTPEPVNAEQLHPVIEPVPVITIASEPVPTVVKAAPVVTLPPDPVVEAPATSSVSRYVEELRQSGGSLYDAIRAPFRTPAQPTDVQALAEHFRGSTTAPPPKLREPEPERRSWTPPPKPKLRATVSGPSSWSFAPTRDRSEQTFEAHHGQRVARLKQRAEALHPKAAELTVPAERLGLTDLLKPRRLSRSWEPEKKETAPEALMRSIGEVKNLATLMALEKHMGALETTSERIGRNPAKYLVKTSEAAAAK